MAMTHQLVLPLVYFTMMGATIKLTMLTTLIIGFRAGPDSIFQRVADSIADNTGFVPFAAFTGIGFQVARFVFNRFLGIVPGAAGVGHEDRQQLAADRR